MPADTSMVNSSDVGESTAAVELTPASTAFGSAGRDGSPAVLRVGASMDVRDASGDLPAGPAGSRRLERLLDVVFSLVVLTIVAGWASLLILLLVWLMQLILT